MEASYTLDTINRLSNERQKLWAAKWTPRNKPDYYERLQLLNARIDLLWKQRRVERSGGIAVHHPTSGMDYSDLGNRQAGGGSEWRWNADAEPLPYSDSDWDAEPQCITPVKPLREILAKRGKTLEFYHPNSPRQFTVEKTLPI